MPSETTRTLRTHKRKHGVRFQLASSCAEVTWIGRNAFNRTVLAPKFTANDTHVRAVAGTVEHQDSLGNKGALGPGDVQWMTAGKVILHQEMPEGDSRGRMHGFQLWANLPSSLKMTAPRYQDVKAGEIPDCRGSGDSEPKHQHKAQNLLLGPEPIMGMFRNSRHSCIIAR